MPTTVSISANIPAKLSDMLNEVSKSEERSKSYYIKKGLEQFLKSRLEYLEDLEDYEDAKKAYEDFLASGEKPVPLDEVFKEVK